MLCLCSTGLSAVLSHKGLLSWSFCPRELSEVIEEITLNYMFFFWDRNQFVSDQFVRTSGVGFQLMRMMRETHFAGWNAFLCMHLLLQFSCTFRLTYITNSAEHKRIIFWMQVLVPEIVLAPIYLSSWVQRAFWNSSGHLLMWVLIENWGVGLGCDSTKPCCSFWMKV